MTAVPFMGDCLVFCKYFYLYILVFGHNALLFVEKSTMDRTSERSQSLAYLVGLIGLATI